MYNEIFCAKSCYCTKGISFVNIGWCPSKICLLVLTQNSLGAVLQKSLHPDTVLLRGLVETFHLVSLLCFTFHILGYMLLKRDLVLNSSSTFFEVLFHLVQLFLPASEDRTMAAGAEEEREDGLARDLPRHLSHQP